MAKKGKKQTKPFCWDIPAPHESVDAFLYFLQSPPKPAKLTVPFVVHKPSGWKIPRWLDAYAYADHLIEQILAHWKEDWQCPRDDGALAQILGVHDMGQYKSRSFGEVIRKKFPLAADSPFDHRFHESVCRHAAQLITGWAQQIIQLAIDEYR